MSLGVPDVIEKDEENKENFRKRMQTGEMIRGLKMSDPWPLH